MRIKKNWPVFAANGNPVDGSQSALSHGQSALLPSPGITENFVLRDREENLYEICVSHFIF
jgi:hypothetical protein